MPEVAKPTTKDPAKKKAKAKTVKLTEKPEPASDAAKRKKKTTTKKKTTATKKKK